jgi:PUA-domain protein
MIRRRRSMKRKAAKELLEEIHVNFPYVEADKFEEAEVDDKLVYYLDNQIEFVRDENGLYPYIGGKYVDKLPTVVVDMGAIPYVCNGADIMAPGIVEIRQNFIEGDFVVIRDVVHGKALAIGKANKGADEIEKSKKGKVIKNLSFVGDKLWNAI